LKEFDLCSIGNDTGSSSRVEQQSENRQVSGPLIKQINSCLGKGLHSTSASLLVLIWKSLLAKLIQCFVFHISRNTLLQLCYLNHFHQQQTRYIEIYFTCTCSNAFNHYQLPQKKYI